MNYYCLISGLPEINIDDHKISFSVADFKKEVCPQLSKKDRKLFELYFTRFDNRNLLLYLKDKETTLFDPRGNLSKEELEEGLIMLREDDTPKSPAFPPYFKVFMDEYLDSQHPVDSFMWEDRLNDLYYQWAIRSDNKTVSEWFTFNLNLNNILTAYSARKHELDVSTQVIGSDEIAESIRTSSQRDFGLLGMLSYIEDIQRIAEETDLFEREKKIDLLRWQWLEENTYFKYFGIEQVFSYLVKIEIVERWLELDPESGEKIFRELIFNLKQAVVSDRDSINQQVNIR